APMQSDLCRRASSAASAIAPVVIFRFLLLALPTTPGLIGGETASSPQPSPPDSPRCRAVAAGEEREKPPRWYGGSEREWFRRILYPFFNLPSPLSFIRPAPVEKATPRRLPSARGCGADNPVLRPSAWISASPQGLGTGG